MAEGWFAAPSVDAIAKRFFPEIKDSAARYSRAINLILERVGASRPFCNYRQGEITPDRLRQHPRTVEMFKRITDRQKGDIMIFPAQFGQCHRGQSVRRAREVFQSNEFGLGAFVVMCMAFAHPERFVRWEHLHADCAGDEFAPDAGGVFSRAPCCRFRDGELEFGTGDLGRPHERFGTVSGFLPE